jgi:SAM-dependent methyltransferase
VNASMQAEFDTVASWTADVALDLGPDYHLPAACRGSGSPSALRWLLDRLAPSPDERMLDCGAGVGGPSAFSRTETGIAPVLSDPEYGACRAAQRLFNFPAVQARTPLPFATAAFDVAWSLGVLCTLGDQDGFLAELSRVLRPAGRLGLLVFVAAEPLREQPEGNHFLTPEGLRSLLPSHGLTVVDSASVADFAAEPTEWQQRTARVEDELRRRHGTDPRWLAAADQADIMGRLLADGRVTGELVVASRPSDRPDEGGLG